MIVRWAFIAFVINIEGKKDKKHQGNKLGCFVKRLLRCYAVHAKINLQSCLHQSGRTDVLKSN